MGHSLCIIGYLVNVTWAESVKGAEEGMNHSLFENFEVILYNRQRKDDVTKLNRIFRHLEVESLGVVEINLNGRMLPVESRLPKTLRS